MNLGKQINTEAGKRVERGEEGERERGEKGGEKGEGEERGGVNESVMRSSRTRSAGKKRGEEIREELALVIAITKSER